MSDTPNNVKQFGFDRLTGMSAVYSLRYKGVLNQVSLMAKSLSSADNRFPVMRPRGDTNTGTGFPTSKTVLSLVRLSAVTLQVCWLQGLATNFRAGSFHK